ncbi:tRNA (5-methylaminomethyl-2-thiouridine)(34)-methyltransferase MnmD [Aureitalea marina]|uniref:SAM-dependent methyltransferase n=1 Tax=Aureitalea marina TaxID=930804 RepID=A0A2S7KMH0_9FLAO|nr:tRNA (5-methylaminomethyl-2-thiouridine)(34)-methyltransferase MnmD [Aureitalea marina]PQB03829.1 SAM-dependent methyltransferase [Aureitalea marina]
MKRKLLRTADGSLTIHLPEWNEHYHSHHGAIAEAEHVFMQMGLNHCLKQFDERPIAVLEIGFGTGLNALMTLQQGMRQGISFHYRTLEAYPVAEMEYSQLNYPELLEADSKIFSDLHQADWNTTVNISPGFDLEKVNIRLEDFEPSGDRHLIFFDAFGPRVQPELWTETVFEKMHAELLDGGSLVTYSAKGSVRRAMQSVGFEVERLPGPPGKREMLRATRT